jgi:hypothetical protein
MTLQSGVLKRPNEQMLGKLPTLSSVEITQRRCFPSGAIEHSPMTGGVLRMLVLLTRIFNMAWRKLLRGASCQEQSSTKETSVIPIDSRASETKFEYPRVTFQRHKVWNQDWRRVLAEGLDTEGPSPADSRWSFDVGSRNFGYLVRTAR